MISINTYAVTERAVVEGVQTGVEELLKDVNSFSKPNIVVGVIAQSVLDKLCEVMDFSQAPIRFTNDMLRKVYLTQLQENTNPQTAASPVDP